MSDLIASALGADEEAAFGADAFETHITPGIGTALKEVMNAAARVNERIQHGGGGAHAGLDLHDFAALSAGRAFENRRNFALLDDVVFVDDRVMGGAVAFVGVEALPVFQEGFGQLRAADAGVQHGGPGDAPAGPLAHPLLVPPVVGVVDDALPVRIGQIDDIPGMQAAPEAV